MDPSNGNRRESARPRPTAEQLAAFAASSQNTSTKRTASDMRDLETPQASRPMLALEKSRHRPHVPELAPQQHTDPPLLPLAPSTASPSSGHARGVPVPQTHLQPPLSSSTIGLSQPANDGRPLPPVNTISPTKMARPPSVPSLPYLPAHSTPLPRLHPLPPVDTISPTKMARPPSAPSLPYLPAYSTPLPRLHPLPPSAPLPGLQTLTTPTTLLSYLGPFEGADATNQDQRSKITEDQTDKISLAWERKMAAAVQKARDETRRSVEQTLSTNAQVMYHAAMATGRSEGKAEMQAKLDEAEGRVEELRKRLDPATIKAAYDQGVQDGRIVGYNKYSLNPDTKPSDDRLAFEQILQEKNRAIEGQQRELNERQHRIEQLECQANDPTAQHPRPQLGQNLSNEQIQNALNQFNAQSQELVNVKRQNEQMRADLNNCEVQRGLISTDLANWRDGCNQKSGQLSTCQRQLEQSMSDLGQAMRELKESKEEGERETGKLSRFQDQLKKKAEELDNYQRQAERQSGELEKAGILAIEQAAAIKSQEAEIHRLNLRLEGVQIQKRQTSSPLKPIIDEAQKSQGNALKADLANAEAQLNAAQMEIGVLREKHTKTLQSCSAMKRQSRQAKTSLYIRTTKNSELEAEVNRLTSQLEQKDVALATASGDYSKLQKTHNDMGALCQQIASDLESKQNELDRAIGKAVEVRALERKVDGLNSLIEALERQKSSLLGDFPDDSGAIPTRIYGWRTAQRQAGMQRPIRDRQSAASLQKDDDKAANSGEEAMFRLLHIPLAEGKAILEKLRKSERPSREAPAIIAAELTGAPIQIIKNVIGSMRFRPDHANSKQLIVSGLLGLPEDIVNKICTNREGTIAALTKPPQRPIDRTIKRCKCGEQKAAETASRVQTGHLSQGRFWVAFCVLIGCLGVYASYRQANV